MPRSKTPPPLAWRLFRLLYLEGKAIRDRCRRGSGEILGRLRRRRAAGVIEGCPMPSPYACPDPVPPEIGASGSMGCLKGRGAQLMFDRRATSQGAIRSGTLGLCPMSKPPAARVVVIAMDLCSWIRGTGYRAAGGGAEPTRYRCRTRGREAHVMGRPASP